MTVFYSLESRSLSTGLAQRTIKNLEFMRRAHENGEDVHIVTQVVNSLLFPDLTSLRVRQFECCENLSDFFRHLRNAISHRRIEFSSESHDLHEVMLRLTDGRSCTNWDIDLSAHDLLTLCMYISDEIVRQIL
jgi:hypothetical protein